MDWLYSLIDWHVCAVIGGKVAGAYFLALPIGWEREQAQHSIGVRTFPLVAMASCGYVLLADTLAGPDMAARSRPPGRSDAAIYSSLTSARKCSPRASKSGYWS